jgi:DNA-binding transcriptional LysR family regulator
MIRNIELDALVQTLITAEQGSFHKAGLLLGVRPSTISRRVRQLEDRVGVSLFVRHRHGIRPTDAGKLFLETTRRIISDLEALLRNARTAGRGESGWLRVGLYVSLSTGPLRETLLAYMDRFAAIEVRIIDESRHSLMERLNSDALDVVIVTGQVGGGSHQVLPLWSERILLAVPEDHRLRSQAVVSWDDLRRERIVFSSRDPGPELRDALIARLNGSGVQPVFVQTSADRDTVIGLVALRRSITLLYGSNAGVTHPGVVYREISGHGRTMPLRCFACWHERNDNPALKQFLALLREEAIAAQRQAQPRTAGD